jgi:hypothetical protein
MRKGSETARPRPHHVAGLRKADKIDYATRHYAENPRKHAGELRVLGVKVADIRKIHADKVGQPKRTQGQRLAKPRQTPLEALNSMRRGQLRYNKTARFGSSGGGIAERFAHDLITAAVYSPAGIYQAGKAVGGDVVSTAKGKPTLRGTTRIGKAVAHGIAQDIRHPLRHPGYTGLDVLGIAAPIAGTGARIGATGRALAGGENIAKALTRKSAAGGSVLHAPPPGRIVHQIGELKVETPASRNVLRRQVQKRRAAAGNKSQSPAHLRRTGAALQRQGHIEAEAARAPSNLLEHQGHKLPKGGQTALRVVAEGKPLEERIRFHREQGRKAMSMVERKDHALELRRLRRAARYVETVDGKPMIRSDAPVIGKVYGQLRDVGAQREKILEDTGQMTAQGLEARKHAPGRVIEGARMETQKEATKARGVSPQRARVAQIREYPGRSKTVTTPRTEAQAKARLAELDKKHEKIVGTIAARMKEEMGGKFSASETARRNLSTRALTGKAGKRAQSRAKLQAEGGRIVSQSEELRAAAEKRLQEVLQRNPAQAKRFADLEEERTALRNALQERALQTEEKLPPLGTVTTTIPGKPRRVHLREQQARKRVKATPRLAGAEGFKGGEVYVPGFVSEPKLGGAISRPSGTVVGRVRGLISKSKPYTGEALQKGKVPENTTGLVSRQTLRAVRYLQSDRFRQQVLKAAHDERRGEHDILINDRSLKNPQIPAEAKALLGKEKYTLDELSGHATAFEDFRRKLFPMAHKDDYAALSPEERLAAQDGGKVKGYKWVDERLLRGANKPASYVSNKGAKAAVGLVDSINNASKLAILYLKPAYAIPNITGNAFLNIVQQGFAAPMNLKRAAYLSHKIGEKATATLDSVMGEGIARAISAEHGLMQGAVNFAAGKWSGVVDLPFRRASFIHEARKLGYNTPQKLEQLLTDEAHGADLLEVTQRATDSIIDYSRLGEAERNIVRRVIFFYPWVKGSTYYGGHYIAEHPTQAAVMAQLAQQGKETTGLGPVPSYLEGSFKVGGQLVNPASAGIFGTSGQVLDTLRGVAEGHPTEAARLSQFLTPAAGLGLSLITRQNSLGIPFAPGAGIGDIAKQTLVNSLPQAALYRRAHDLATGADQSRRLFPVKGVGDVVKPFLIGGVAGRSYNPTVMHAQAKREDRSLLSPAQRIKGDYRTFGQDLRAAISKNPNTKLTPELRGRLALRYERAAARQKAAGGHKLDARTALLADVGLIAQHKWIDKATAAKWTASLQKAAKGDLPEVSRFLTTHYFDPDGVLSESVKYLRDNGHPNLKVPTLP